MTRHMHGQTYNSISNGFVYNFAAVRADAVPQPGFSTVRSSHSVDGPRQKFTYLLSRPSRSFGEIGVEAAPLVPG